MRWLWLLAICLSASAHVGVNDIFFEGLAGPYPLYVTVRPPVVIPGVAEISIRSAARDVAAIQITPMALSGAGSKYPPTPDLAVQSKEDPQLFTGGLWIMASGAWQVRAIVDGARGPAAVSIPVPATSQKVTTMDFTTGVILSVLMLLLAAGVIGIAGAAVRDAQLPPGALPDAGHLRRGRLAMVAGLALAALIIWQGRDWWNDEARAYARSLYTPLLLSASLDQDFLMLEISAPTGRAARSIDDLIADHGHLIHLYLLKSPGLEAAYHLHPERLAPGRFRVKLPAIPAGDYRLFADIVHANGFPETLTASIELPADSKGPAASGDDAGALFSPNEPNPLLRQLSGGGTAELDLPGKLKSGQPLSLRFRILDSEGNPAPNLKPYLGMAAHLAVVKKDFSVFSHIHPNGNISMAAFEMAQSNLFPIDPSVLRSSHVKEGAAAVVPAEFNFPFGFPSPGDYRLILQFARQDRVETVSFDISVQTR